MFTCMVDAAVDKQGSLADDCARTEAGSSSPVPVDGDVNLQRAPMVD